MAEIHVYTAEGVQSIHPEERVLELLRSGELPPATLYWREGMAEWQPLNTFKPAPPRPAFIPPRHTEPQPEFGVRQARQTVPAAAPSAVPGAPSEPAKLRPPRVHFRRYPEPLTTVLQLFLLLCIGLTGLQLAIGLLHYNLLSIEVSAFTDHPTNGGYDPWLNFTEAFGDTGFTLFWVVAGVNLVLIVPFFMWVYQAVINSHHFSSIAPYRPGWAVGCYFVPAINLYLPCVMMQQIWKVSRNPRTWHNDRASFLVGIWWTLWLVRSVLTRFPLLLAARSHTHAAIVTASLWQVATVAIDVVFFSVFFAMITVIVQNQKRIVAAGQRQRETAIAPASPTAPTAPPTSTP